jgi:TRAP-type C4-dicarboxylate transport system substrate-binding protein
MLSGLGSAATRAAEFTLKIATVAPTGTPWAELLNRYQKQIETLSGGRIDVKIYIGGKAGDENEAVKKTSRGHLEAVAASTGALASLVPELHAVELPFLFRSFGEADYILDKVLTEPMDKLFRDRGLVFGFWSENGFRHFGASVPIKSPADLSGRKMRSQESPVHLEMWSQFKAAAQAIPTTEVLTALQTGGVEGFDQGLLYAIATSWHKQVKVMTLSAHIYQPAAVAYNKEWFDKLPPDLQQIVMNEGRALTDTGRKLIRAINPDLIKLIEQAGVQIVKLDAGQRSAFESAAMPVRSWFRQSQGAGAVKILDAIEAGLKSFRK